MDFFLVGAKTVGSGPTRTCHFGPALAALRLIRSMCTAHNMSPQSCCQMVMKDSVQGSAAARESRVWTAAAGWRGSLCTVVSLYESLQVLDILHPLSPLIFTTNLWEPLVSRFYRWGNRLTEATCPKTHFLMSEREKNGRRGKKVKKQVCLQNQSTMY